MKTVIMSLVLLSLNAMADSCQVQCYDAGWGNKTCYTNCAGSNSQPSRGFDTSMYQHQPDYAADIQNAQLRQLEIQRRQLEIQRMQNGN